ncbi:MAG: hypothetical protein WAM60_18305 [Candidatus Promineifilaceae bacterium]
MSKNGNFPHQTLIKIASFVVALHTNDAGVTQKLEQRYQEFLGSDETPDISITLKIVPGALYIEPKPGPWVIESSYKNNRLVYCSYQERGEVDLISGEGYLEMDPTASIDNFLRTVYAWLCVTNDALLLHSAGVIRDGLGYVFFGPSGAGKTTTSRLASKTAHVVSDDLVIIRCDETGCTLHGVPFKGELSEAPRANQQAPLKGLYRLRQDTSHYLEPIPHIKAIADLVAASPFIVREKELSDQLMKVCSKIVECVPVQQLHFKRDDGFWKVLLDE